MIPRNQRFYPCAIATMVCLLHESARAGIEWSGLLDVRAAHTRGERSWTEAGLGKARSSGGTELRLGQGVLAAELEISNAVSALAVVDASSDRRHLLDMQEAWLAWNPVPQGAWKVRAKAGIFFPPLNQEINYQRLHWLPERTVSASAVNAWMGEELKTKGVELSLTHRGRSAGSPHDIGVMGALFNGNDPAGTLLTWRGWSVGDRLTGAAESLRLADLPVYRPDGAISRQTRDIHLFREIDGRLGFYGGASYAYADQFQIAVMHYDNRGDPLVVKAGQYSWATKFDHAALRLQTGQWTWLAQYMAGSTVMGARAAALDFKAWYALASRPVGRGRLTVRYDRFAARERDQVPSDPNGEQGHAVALAYAVDVNGTLSVVNEVLLLHSTRPARSLLGEAARQKGASVTSALRWQF